LTELGPPAGLGSPTACSDPETVTPRPVKSLMFSPPFGPLTGHLIPFFAPLVWESGEEFLPGIYGFLPKVTLWQLSLRESF